MIAPKPATADSPTSVSSLATQWFLSLVQEESLADGICDGTVGADILHDLSRAIYLSPMREGVAASPQLVAALASQLEALTRHTQGDGAERDKKPACAAGAVLLVRVAKKFLRSDSQEALKEPILDSARDLFTLRKGFEPDLVVGLALQLAFDPKDRTDAIEWLLQNQESVERARDHYFATSSLSELHARIRERWDDQHKRDGLDGLPESLERFGGLSPFLHAMPAPGGIGDTVSLVRQFARALDIKNRDEATKDLRSWLKDVGKAQRLIQWELCSQQGGKYVALGAARKLVTVLDDTFLDELTRAWWRHLLDYEPFTFGRPVNRSEIADPGAESDLGDILQEAHASLRSFTNILDDPKRVEPDRDIQSANIDLVRREWDRGGGSFVLHDGELTFCTLGWLWRNDGQWHWPELIECNIKTHEISGAGFLKAMGLGVSAGQETILSARWRSFARWLRAVADMTKPDREFILRGWEATRDFRTNVAKLWDLGLNRACTEAVLERLGLIAAAAAPREPWKPDENRVPFLPAEVFLRAYRPWPSHLVVSTIHAQRVGSEIVPLSFGFATIVGDLPQPLGQDSTGGDPGVKPGNAPADSWLANQCSLLAGMGTSLGVSLELAKDLKTEEYLNFAELIWPAETEDWFPERLPHNHWDVSPNQWKLVTDHLVGFTGTVEQDFPTHGALKEQKKEFWEEMKAFFGRLARIRNGDNPLTLNGVWLLLAAYLQQQSFGQRPSIGEFPIGHLDRVEKNGYATDLMCSCDPACRSCSSRGTKAVASHLLLELFPALLHQKNGGRVCTLRRVERKSDVLWLELDIGYSRLWAALMSTKSGGDSTEAIRTYCRLVGGSKGATKAEREQPATLRVEQSVEDRTRIGFAAWRSS